MNSIHDFYTKIGFDVTFICNQVILRSGNFKIDLSYIDKSSIDVAVSIQNDSEYYNISSRYVGSFSISTGDKSPIDYHDIDGKWLNDQIKNWLTGVWRSKYDSLCRNNKLELLGL